MDQDAPVEKEQNAQVMAEARGVLATEEEAEGAW
jgi:hypothetical protein